ncbi:hypothetical protein [Aestuariibaculum sediminum]|uniref:hypothetical protein n=1 Tax=Aestuariibaculum sediminum TaxID=2770637 RepID=UPI001CB71AB6|nr:hypothetical protein [Aestuariibaculum sediminum]
MNKIALACLITLILLFTSCKKVQHSVATSKIEIEAPFKIPDIIIPDFSNCKQFVITDFGAIKNNKELISQAIEDAIDEANSIGSGIVVIPEGEWITKSIHLKSNVNLHLNKGAILLFSETPEDYLPAVHST